MKRIISRRKGTNNSWNLPHIMMAIFDITGVSQKAVAEYYFPAEKDVYRRERSKQSYRRGYFV
jgi:hypothetical protein